VKSNGGSHEGGYSANDLRIAQSAERLNEMGHFAHDLMHGCILRSEPQQRGVEVQPLVESFGRWPRVLSKMKSLSAVAHGAARKS
jgi:hypothetical protein